MNRIYTHVVETLGGQRIETRIDLKAIVGIRRGNPHKVFVTGRAAPIELLDLPEAKVNTGAEFTLGCEASIGKLEQAWSDFLAAEDIEC